MTNYERIQTMKLDELADFLLSLTSLLNPSYCTGCPAQGSCESSYGDTCEGCIRKWLKDTRPEWEWGHDYRWDIQHKTIDELAAFFGTIGHHIFDEGNCQDCPATKECRERDAENCEQAFRFLLEAEAENEDENNDREITPGEVLAEIMPRAVREQENLFLSIIEQYERGEQPDPEDKDLFDMIVERYERGCACVYCPKSAVPDRSPEKDVCTPSDCARGLSEYINRMED